jgi:hypothetical protein
MEHSTDSFAHRAFPHDKLLLSLIDSLELWDFSVYPFGYENLAKPTVRSMLAELIQKNPESGLGDYIRRVLVAYKRRDLLSLDQRIFLNNQPDLLLLNPNTNCAYFCEVKSKSEKYDIVSISQASLTTYRRISKVIPVFLAVEHINGHKGTQATWATDVVFEWTADNPIWGGSRQPFGIISAQDTPFVDLNVFLYDL